MIGPICVMVPQGPQPSYIFSCGIMEVLILHICFGYMFLGIFDNIDRALLRLDQISPPRK